MSQEDAHDAPPVPEMFDRHAIIAGFGVPGRAVAEALRRRGVTYCVVEMNPDVVLRLANVNTPVIPGDAADESVLIQAGIERAVLFAIAIPNDQAVLAATKLARRLNPNVRIIARCRYVSASMQTARSGADEVVCDEQVVAAAFAGLVGGPKSVVSSP